ncbi:MAG: AsmA-like C-terminal domain-containing protein, partial [Dongia sp.]
LQLNGDHPVDITGLSIAGDGFAIVGGATFSPDGKSIGKLSLKKAQFAKSAITDLVADFSNDGTAVSVGGGVMDVEPWMAERDKPVTPQQLDADELKPQRAYSIAGTLSQVRISEGDTMTNVTFDLRHDPVWWDKIYFNGTLPSGVPLVFNYAPTGQGTHKLAVKTDDAGGAFKALGIYDSIRGGQITITGEAKDDSPHRAMKGQMEMTSFRLLHTPFAVRFLSVAALTGLVDALTGEGFLFAGASAKFTKTRGRIDVADFHSAGPSLGLTSKGSIDMDANTVDLKGALVPAYAFNSILGNIPIIGEFLQGGKGEGLFSATYSIAGDLNNPKIDVNGWSALAPGFLRNMFDGDGTDNLTAPPERKTPKN